MGQTATPMIQHDIAIQPGLEICPCHRLNAVMGV
jgi:hypothetical protein